ncbi:MULTISPECIES: hypothetical protein [unclassified Nostoc]|nr:hypothetical protein [Nostoc sp. 'Peltigera membranacea cyanobiont' 213]
MSVEQRSYNSSLPYLFSPVSDNAKQPAWLVSLSRRNTALVV